MKPAQLAPLDESISGALAAPTSKDAALATPRARWRTCQRDSPAERRGSPRPPPTPPLPSRRGERPPPLRHPREQRRGQEYEPEISTRAGCRARSEQWSLPPRFPYRPRSARRDSNLNPAGIKTRPNLRSDCPGQTDTIAPACQVVQIAESGLYAGNCHGHGSARRDCSAAGIALLAARCSGLTMLTRRKVEVRLTPAITSGPVATPIVRARQHAALTAELSPPRARASKCLPAQGAAGRKGDPSATRRLRRSAPYRA